MTSPTAGVQFKLNVSDSQVNPNSETESAVWSVDSAVGTHSVPSESVGVETEPFDTDSTSTVNTVHDQNAGGDHISGGTQTPPVEDRKRWGNKLDFLMSCISMSVGLGNVWRFPMTAYSNGGGAFLIPYMVALFIVGRPIYFLELTLGQFTSRSQIEVWRCTPFFKGVGYAGMFAAMIVMTYYVAIMGTTMFYFFASFAKVLPWAYCDPEWAGEGVCENETSKTAAELYLKKHVFRELPNLNQGVGEVNWKLCLCLLASWVLIFASIFRGVSLSGKVAWFTALFPYVVLFILLFRGMTLSGAMTGIMYFLTPDFSKLLHPQVWFAAVTQCLYSLNVGLGSLMMLGSYNEFHHNVYKDALIVSLTDTFTSLLAGLTIFSILGHLAETMNTPINNIVDQGPGLVFVSYPNAIAQFSIASQFFAVLFFVMLYTLGLGSATSDVGGIVSIFCDKYPRLKRWKICAVICVFGFLLGIVYTTQNGQYLVELIDTYGGGLVVYVISIVEVIAIAWVYGLYNYLDDIEFMLGRRLGIYWKVCWGLCIPIVLTTVLIYSLALGYAPKYNGETLPDKALYFGWFVASVPLLSFPLAAWHQMTRVVDQPFYKRILIAMKPHISWGPQNPDDLISWQDFKAERPKLTFWQRIKERKF